MHAARIATLVALAVSAAMGQAMAAAPSAPAPVEVIEFTPVATAALVEAARTQDATAVQALLRERNMDVSQASADGTTALHWAARRNEMELARALLKKGANVNATTQLGATPLYLAAVNGSADMIALLLKAGADPNADLFGRKETALMFAARSGNVSSVERLVKAGAQVNAAEDYRQTTALMWAAERNNAGAVSALIAAGASLDAASKVTERRSSGKSQRRPERDAQPAQAGAGTVEGATAPAQRPQFASSADPAPSSAPAAPEPRPGAAGFREPQGGVTALVLAARENAIEAATLLLDAGAPINQQSGDGSTALLVAVQNVNLDMARMLIARGADVSLQNKKGWNPLYLAVKNRSMEVGTMPAPPQLDREALFGMIKLLVEKGANVNARVKDDTEMRNAIKATWLLEAGGTPFLRASLCGDLEVMKYLLAHGADPLIATEDNTTALAALAGVGFTKGFMEDLGSEETSLEAMRLLISLGIDVNAENKDHTTALHGAAHKNFASAIQLLVEHGADMTAVSQRRGTFERSKEFKGNTVMDYAYGVQTGGESSVYHPEAVDMLKKLSAERGITLIRNGNTDGGVTARLVSGNVDTSGNAVTAPDAGASAASTGE